MSHIAANRSRPIDCPRHYSGRAFVLARFYTRPMALRIRHLRVKRGWTQQDLADRANMSRSQLAMIEAETRPANTLRLNAIASALEVAPEALFDSGDGHWHLVELVQALDEGDRETLVRLAESLAAKRAKG